MADLTDATSNGRTLASYEGYIADYIDGTSKVVTGAVKTWIDAALDGLPSGAGILELGSGFGRDAAYVASRGYDVECSDAADGFVSHLRREGFRARRFNVITDELTERYDLILANAVLLHFTEQEFTLVTAKLFRGLKPGGQLAISLKRGRGESWSNEKIGAPRFFRYWEPEGLAPVLAAAGFVRSTIDGTSTEGSRTAWLFVIAHKPDPFEGGQV